MALQQPQSCKLEHTIRTLQRRIQNIRLRNVAACLENLHPRILQRPREIFRRAAHEIVINHDLADIFLHQKIHRMGPDQTRPANHHKTLTANIHQKLS